MTGRKRLRQNTAGSSSSPVLPLPRPDPENQPTSLGPSASEPSLPNQTTSSDPKPNADSPTTNPTPQKFVRKARSWYGPWPQPPKAAASTSVARENIFGAVKSGKAPDLSRFEHKPASDASSIHSVAPPMPSLPEVPENGASPSPAKGDAEVPTTTTENEADIPPAPSLPPAPEPETTAAAPASEPPATPPRPATSSGWLGWLSRTPFTDSQPALNTEVPQKIENKEPGSRDVNTSSVAKEADANEQLSTQPDNTAMPESAKIESPKQPAPSASWFGFWSSTAETSPKKAADEPVQPDPKPSDAAEDVVMQDAPPLDSLAPPEQKPAQQATPQKTPKAGSTWAFWSKDTPNASPELTRQESGEIAVMGEGSEAHPKPMKEDDMAGEQPNQTKQTKAKDIQTPSRSTWGRKRVRPASMDVTPSSSPAKSSIALPEPSPALPAQERIQPPTPVKAESSGKASTESAQAKLPPNLLLPSFSSTYRLKENPSIIKQIAQLLLRTSQPPANHVYRAKETPKIKKAIAIGVHGLFPAAYLRPMIGQPTGTSLRFANLCAESIRKWADEHGCSDCEIEKVALEGEGKIGERVENLWKLLLNWMEHLRSADLIIMASHSQGVPVSIMLLEKLIDLGIITNAKIGVCAMAGVALGPFPEYKSSILGGAAAELWEFGDQRSANSQRFEAALKRILDYGARVTFIGSIDDQLVPMESAVYSRANHPYIYRAVFIDGRIHAPDFISHLVGFALKLRNLGISDHGLIRELSLPLAGSLYGGEGHSRIYYDPAVYDLAISHCLETTVAAAPSASFEAARRETLSTPNPYVLPWIMRGLLEEDLVKTELSSETEELLRQFDDWKPTTKALKDVKYRLEAVRSRL
ncbi:hypothetical protein B0I35DRAFT_380997 [Stachybotrys elegans]|uniref:YMC020W-like alpha/beta hydrolase domain-containing protein n=1 Tax=Stachybotrys elegans TaxID=80388 RepID=A0A8K0SI00_9HYPO|nr:hypothetical protein B0I35DRAFT_380997 [Stachybotrys elegans]